MSAPVLELDAVSRTFGRGRAAVRAVHEVDLVVGVGEAVGLVGASGAGKSTVAGIATGLVAPQGGRVLVDGAVRDPNDRHAARRVHLVFQDPYASLAPHLTVDRIVAEPLEIHREADRGRRVAAALESVRLDPAIFLARRPHELSGGERQRVALARAVVARPGLVVADEPTQMLDASTRLELLDLMAHLRRVDGTAFLYITHDLALAQSFCDRLAVMSGGRIVEEGTTSDLLSAPTHPATRALVEAVRELQSALPPVAVP